MYAFYLPLISDYESSNFPGSNAYFGWVFAAAIPCLTANPSLVSFLLEQRIRKPLFILNDRVVSNFQAHIRCWEGIIIFNIHFVYSLSVPMFLSAERIDFLARVLISTWLLSSAPTLFFPFFVIMVRCNPSFRHWRRYHVKRFIMGLMQHQSR